MYRLRDLKEPTIQQRFDSLARAMRKLEVFSKERKGSVMLSQDEAFELNSYIQVLIAAEWKLTGSLSAPSPGLEKVCGNDLTRPQ